MYFNLFFTEWDELIQELTVTQSSAFAPGTLKNLRSQCKTYLYFTSYYGLSPFPATPVRLALFAQFLARSFKSATAIQNYISGIRTAHVLLGEQPPDTSHVVLRLCLRGLQRIKPGVVRRASPITPHMLTKMADKVDPRSPHQWACWTAILIGFFTFARRSNLVPKSSSSFNPSQQLQRADLIRGHDQLIVLFKWSKTIQNMQRTLVIPVPVLPGINFCPVQAYDHLVKLTPAKPSDPAFSIRNKRKVRAISQGHLQEALKDLVNRIGFDPTNFSSHSLRRGGASWASKAGCAAMEIKNFGDWRSDCFTIYIDSSFEQREEVAHKMAQCILKERQEI